VARSVGEPKRQSGGSRFGFRLPVGDPSAEPDELLYDRSGIRTSFELQSELDCQWKSSRRSMKLREQAVCHDRRSRQNAA
jgi:hypothetical protein